MRKSTKIALLVAALVALCSFAALAQGWTWDEAAQEWTYIDKYDEVEFLKWEKDADGRYYYLGEEGLMLRNQLIDDGTNKYWVGGDGAKVVNAWVQVPADDTDIDELDVEYRWYYFGSTGKATVATNKTINGEKYYFDAEGKMLFGYHNGTVMADNQDSPFTAECKYYSGTNEDGALKKSVWYKVDVVEDHEAYEDTTSNWVFFKSNGTKATDADEYGVLWNGQRYYFDADGRMKYGWSTIGSASTKEVYLNGEDEGWMAKKTWVYTNKRPDGTKTSDEGDKWFWVNTDGTDTAKKGVRKINTKFYAFDENGEMLAEFVALTGAETAITSATWANPVETDVAFDEWTAVEKLNVYYFSGDYKNDGSLKKAATFEADLADDTYKFTTDKAGKLANREYNKKFYINGILIAADPDYKYEVKVVTLTDGTKAAKLLNTVGTSVKVNSVVADAEGNYFYVTDAKIYMAPYYLDSPAKAAQYFKNNKSWKVGADDYHAEVKEAVIKDGVELYSVLKVVPGAI